METHALATKPWQLAWPLTLDLPERGALTLTRPLDWQADGWLCAEGQLAGQPVCVTLFLGSDSVPRFDAHVAAVGRLREAGESLPDAFTVRLPSGVSLMLWQTNASHWPCIQDYRLGAALPDEVRLESVRAALTCLLAWQQAGVVPERVELADLGVAGPALPLHPLGKNDPGSESLMLDFLAALPPACDYFQDELLQGMTALPADRISAERDRRRRARVLGKLPEFERESWYYLHQRDWHRETLVARHAASWCEPLLAPQALLDAGEPLKLGTSNTVVRVRANDRVAVLKRYNMKTRLVRLKRLARVSRPLDAWRAIHAFVILGVATAPPLALVRDKWGPLHGLAWMLNDEVDAPALLARLAPCEQQGELPPALAEQLAVFFRSMHAARLTHGDLKHRNLLWPAAGPVSIDMDAARYHGGNTLLFRRAWSKDRQRLLANWPPAAPLRAALEALVPEGEAS